MDKFNQVEHPPNPQNKNNDDDDLCYFNLDNTS